MVDVHSSTEAKAAELQADNKDIWDAIDQLHDIHDKQKSMIIYNMKQNVEYVRQLASLYAFKFGLPTLAAAGLLLLSLALLVLRWLVHAVL